MITEDDLDAAEEMEAEPPDTNLRATAGGGNEELLYQLGEHYAQRTLHVLGKHTDTDTVTYWIHVDD